MKRILKPTPKFDNRQEIILRDFLALERTRLANERTLLSYLKGSMYLFVASMTIIKLEEFENIESVGYFSLAISIIALAVGLLRFFQLKHRLKNYYADEKFKF